MFSNYLKSAFRHLKKYRFYTIINITGLAIGLVASILLFLYIRYEMSYDTFHQGHEQIYRIVSHVDRPGGKSMVVPRTLAKVSEAMKREIPAVLETNKLYEDEVTLIDEKKHMYPDIELMYTDSSFFDVFSFKVHRGDGASALRTPGEVVITRALANRYFGSDDVVGKEIRRKTERYTVGAVLKDIPANSHFDFDMLTGFYTMDHPDRFMENHGWDFFTYFRVKPGSQEGEWAGEVKSLADGIGNNMMKEIGSEGAFDVQTRVQPMTRIHLYSNYNFEIDPQGDINNIYIFSFLAAFILIIAIVNFINLVTAHAEYRSREIGMRKVLGAHRKMLISQHLIESFMVVLASLILSLILVKWLADPLGNLLGSELVIDWLNPSLLLGLIAFAVIVGLLAGSYPAFYLSRFDPVRIFSSMGSRGSRNRTLQIGLVVVQFGIAIFLITSLIILRSQINYLNNKDLGVNKENILVVQDVTGDIRGSYQAIRDELMKHPSIQSVTASVSYPGADRAVQTAKKAEDPSSESIVIQENRVQDHYVETYDIEITEGRHFRKELASDSTGFILNQQAVDKLGLSKPVGKQIEVFQQKGKVLGVMKDFHFRSFHHQIEPMVLSHYSDYFQNISVKIDMRDVSATLEHVRQVMQEFDSQYYFRYTFIDDVFAQLHQQERQTNRMIMAGSVLAIFLAILGLFALSSFTVVKRSREIAIRKAMGSTYQRVVRLLLIDILRWVVLVNVLAWPAAWYFMSNWLQNFAYRIDLEIWMFLLGGVIALGIAGLTIAVQTLRAAAVNPAEKLRDE
ncbi:MAG: ABC transporter permease [Bacteroidales bacterium]|nr:ABC transporter permease [Bacteroidales bacterium]